MNAQNPYLDLRLVDCSARIEKKNGLSYLSWPFAVDELLQRDPMASWEYPEPKQWGDTWMVFCSVTAFGRTRTAQLPVMDHRNKAIANPDSFAVNTAMQRCLVKAIALHGLGLYIYAGEDLPGGDPTEHTGNGNGHSPLASRQASATAANMLDIIRADLVEERKALQAADLHDLLRTQQSLYEAASAEMTATERREWKRLVKVAHDQAHVEIHGRVVIPT